MRPWYWIDNSWLSPGDSRSLDYSGYWARVPRIIRPQPEELERGAMPDRCFDRENRVVTAEDGSKYIMLTPEECKTYNADPTMRSLRVWATSIKLVDGCASDIYRGAAAFNGDYVRFGDAYGANMARIHAEESVLLVNENDYINPAWGKVIP